MQQKSLNMLFVHQGRTVWLTTSGCIVLFLLLLLRPLSVQASTLPAGGSPTLGCYQLGLLHTHIHAHLSLYVNNKPVTIPAGVGLDIQQGKHCAYYLHTHDPSGVIHVEYPGYYTFSLGDFFGVWGHFFRSRGYPAQLDQSGWVVFINGRLTTINPYQIPLQAHELITMAYHSTHVRPDTSYEWGNL